MMEDSSPQPTGSEQSASSPPPALAHAVPRVDGADKATGRAVYADDIRIDGMLFAKPLHAGHPSARILSIDCAAAYAVPGVVDILTARELPAETRVGTIMADQDVLASDRVRYQGDVIAVVAAESEAAARAGVAAVRVEYEPLPPVFDPARALAPDAPLLHEERGTNLIASYRVRHGDPAAGFSRAAQVIEREYRTQRVEHAYLEPESAIAIPEEGGVTIRGSVQMPFNARRFVARATGLPLERVRVMQATLGGSFGGKDETINFICARAALLALRTGRPVKTTYTRAESMRESYKRHPFQVRARLGVDADGLMQALRIEITADGGPYCTSSPFVIWRPTVQCTGPYKIPAVHCDSRAVYTNNPLTGAMRGFGSPQFNFASESLVDEMAWTCGLDPVEFRRRNFFTQDCVTHTGQRLDNHVVSIAAVMDAALARFGWREKFTRASRGRPDSEGRLHGVGLACSYRGVSLGAEGADFCSAIVDVRPDATVELQVSVSENGSGLRTAMARIAAAELGLPIERVRFLDTDTNTIPDGGPTVASRGTLVGGNALLSALREWKKRVAPVLSSLLGPADRYRFEKGRVLSPDGGRAISFEELVRACAREGLALRVLGQWTGPRVSWDEEHGQGNAYFTYVYGCNCAEVEVSAKTGEVRVIRLLGAHDPGRAIHAQMLEGQIYGGLLMGMGLALSENYAIAEGLGVPQNLNGCGLARAEGAPALEALIVENPDSAGPWGGKSIGEPVNELAAPAIANAIFLATGVRVRELPIRPEAILAGLAKGEASGSAREATGVASVASGVAGDATGTKSDAGGTASDASGSHSIGLRVNGSLHRVRVARDEMLLDVLRDRLGLTGAKRGCDIGVCGTCTVLIDGRPRQACRVRAEALGEAEILTIEGLAPSGGGLHPIQQAFIDAGAIQCGFCTPGMILAAKALLDRHPHPTEAEIRRALRPHLCRCTGYVQIVEAVTLAAKRMERDSRQERPGD
ncbi:MAG: molybdopterin-dependent oxidoreductase [Candidatus Eisenbacteria bacterium]|nr:molybdopterin-dependent oxidoreductase [Candidatus Eisenbacteria bacterium]